MLYLCDKLLLEWTFLLTFPSVPECEEGRYGKNCTEVCRCMNGGRCDRVTGKCVCLRGWTGDLCQSGDFLYLQHSYFIIIEYLLMRGFFKDTYNCSLSLNIMRDRHAPVLHLLTFGYQQQKSSKVCLLQEKKLIAYNMVCQNSLCS